MKELKIKVIFQYEIIPDVEKTTSGANTYIRKINPVKLSLKEKR